MSGPVTLDRREGPYGEVVLRRRDEHYEIIANGTFLMDTSDGRSERRLIDAARDALPDESRVGATVLIGGLGVGFSSPMPPPIPAGAGSPSPSGRTRSSTGTGRDRSRRSPGGRSPIRGR